MYTEFHAGVESDGQNNPNMYKHNKNDAEMTKMEFDPMNLNLFPWRFQTPQYQNQKIVKHGGKSFFRGDYRLCNWCIT